MHINKPIRIILSGGPGTGKTTLVSELQKLGYTVHEEISRQVIQDSIDQGSDALPWKNLPMFSAKVSEGRQMQYAQASFGINIYDRSMIDTVAYLRLDDLPIPDHYSNWINSNRYHDVVLFAPFWEEIYVQDSERKESVQKARNLSQVLKDSYLKYDYSLLELPKSTVEERIAMIKSFLSEIECTG